MSMTQVINELFQAAQTGEVSRMQDLLKSHATLANTENSDGLTPLGYAAHFGQVEAVQVLLDHGADVNAVSHSKVPFIPSNTALHAAIAGERNLDVIKLLLQHNASPDILDSNGHTSLHTAAYHADHTLLVGLLLEHGAQVDAKTSNGTTALDIAEEKGNLQVAELLRRHAERR